MQKPLIIGVLVAFAAFAAWLVFRPTPTEACLNVLPRKSNVGFAVDGKLYSVNIGALQESTGASPEQMSGFIECLKASHRDSTVQASNGVIIPRQPIGQLADAWKSEQGLLLSLEPTPNDPGANRILQNLAIGPFAGTKPAIVRRWCTVQARLCVTCDPEEVGQASNQVIARLRANPPVNRRQMPGNFPPSPANPHQPWEDVNEKGERFYYECRAP